MICHQCHVKTTVAYQLEVLVSHFLSEAHGEVGLGFSGQLISVFTSLLLFLPIGDEAWELGLDVQGPLHVVTLDIVDLGNLFFTLAHPLEDS